MSEEPVAEDAYPADDKSLAAWEIASVVSSVLIAEWLILSVAGGNRLMGALPVTLAYVYILVSQRLRGLSAREVGWRLDNLPRALWLLFVPMLATTSVLLVCGWLNSSTNFGRWHGGRAHFGLPVFGVLWGILQQYVLQGFVNQRAQIIWRKGWRSVLVVALVFAALHLPNPLLTLMTLAGGIIWASVYQRAPNVFALGLSHAFMTWVLISTTPPSTLHSLRVGFNYFL